MRISGLPFLISSCLMLFFTHGIAGAETLTYDGTMQEALDRSYELKIANVDVRLSENSVRTALSQYFPTVRGRANSEYLKDLQGNRSLASSLPSAVVGDQILPTGTRFQNSVGVSLNYTLLDFGIRHRRLDIAKIDILSKKAAADQQSRDLQLRVLDTYTNALLNYRTLKARESILILYRQLFDLKKRLYQAGTASKVELAEVAIQQAQTLDDVESVRNDFHKNLNDLSYFTKREYDEHAVEVEEIPTVAEIQAADFQRENTPEARIYQMTLEQKQKEIEMLKRQYLPQFALYSNYNLYGTDPDAYDRSVGNVSNRTLSVGVNMNVMLFDGFRNASLVNKAKLELERINLEKAQKLDQVQYRFDSAQQELETANAETLTKGTVVNKSQDKLTMLGQLSDQGVVDKTLPLTEHISRIRRQLEAEKQLIQKSSALRKMQIMAAAG